MKAKIDAYDVLESGVLVVQKENIVSLSLGADPLILRFIFRDEESKEQGMQTIISEDGKSLDAILTNFNNHTGTANTEPIELGTFGENPERVLYINFAVYSIEVSKVLHYTFLLGAITA